MFHMLNCSTTAEGNEKGGSKHECTSSFGSAHDDNWAEAGFSDWLFGHDVVQEAEEGLAKAECKLGVGYGGEGLRG